MANKLKSFRSYKKIGRLFLLENKLKDNVLINKNSKVLLSVPHAVPQTRLGKHKVRETGTLPFAMFLSEHNNFSMIVKTKNNFDDANFDIVSKYKTKIMNLVKQNKINYLLDFHGLAKWRECDVNLGVYYGKNIEKNVSLFDDLVKRLNENGFVVTLDQPFCAGPRTISGSVKRKYPQMWTLQVEINCGLTNNPAQIKKCEILVRIFSDWLKTFPL